MVKKRDNLSKLSQEDEKKLFAFLGVLLTVVGFLLAILIKKKDKYVMFYAKQGLILFFVFVIVSALGYILNLIPFFGNIIYGILLFICVLLWIIGIIYSLSNQEKEIPIIGSYAKMLDF